MSAFSFYKSPRGKTNALRNNVRPSAIPPDSWDDKPRSDWQALYKYAKKCRAKSKGFDDFATRLKAKFKVSRDYARDLYDLAYDRYVSGI